MKIVLGLLSTILLFGVALAQTQPPDVAPQIEDNSDFRGKVVVLDFWATWCGPCMQSLPGTNKVAKAYKDKGVVVLAINVWDDPANFKEWVPKHLEYDSILFALDPNGQKEDIAKTLYKVSGIPTQYVIDAKGIIRASFLGAGPEEELEKAIQGALK